MLDLTAFARRQISIVTDIQTDGRTDEGTDWYNSAFDYASDATELN